MNQWIGNGYIPLLSVLVLCLLGILLAGIFRFMAGYYQRSLKGIYKPLLRVKAFIIAEGLVVLIFSVLILKRLLTASPLPGIILLLLLIAIFWSQIKSYIAGFTIRSSKAYQAGIKVMAEGKPAEIRKLSALGIYLQIPGEGMRYVPYSKLDESVSPVLIQDQGRHNLFLEFEIANLASPEFIRQKLSETVLICPYCEAGREAQIELEMDDMGHYIARLAISAYDSSFSASIKRFILLQSGLFQVPATQP